MFQPIRRTQRITVALPATLTLDIPHLREKTTRIGYIGRALAIFRVQRVLIYDDHHTERGGKEARLIEKILSFQETPQYLRKRLFKIDPELAFAGVLPPLRTSHHPDLTEPTLGMLREAAVILAGPSSSTVDAGFKEPLTVRARLKVGERVTIRIKSIRPLEGEIVDPTGLSIYWGLKIIRTEKALGHIIRTGDQDLTISTSRQGMDVREVMGPLQARWKASRRPLILFGSPREGIPSILARSDSNVSQADFNVNTVPNQGVETIRTEEALISTLAVLNLLQGVP